MSSNVSIALNILIALTSQKNVSECNIAVYSECTDCELVYRVSDDVWLCVTVGVTNIRRVLFGLSILYFCCTT